MTRLALVVVLLVGCAGRPEPRGEASFVEIPDGPLQDSLDPAKVLDHQTPAAPPGEGKIAQAVRQQALVFDDVGGMTPGEVGAAGGLSRFPVRVYRGGILSTGVDWNGTPAPFPWTSPFRPEPLQLGADLLPIVR